MQCSLITGNIPGNAASTRLTWVLGSDPNFVEEVENNLDAEQDWIYIDGDHSYPQTKKDLNNSYKVVKSGGKIIGDDYKWPDAKWGKPGTTKAVDEFVQQNKLKMFRHGMTQFSIIIP